MTASGPRPPVISISAPAMSGTWPGSTVSMPNRAAAARRSGDRVDADHPLHAQVLGDPPRELPDRPEAEHGQRAVPGRVGVGHGLVGGGQHVGQEQVLLVRAVRRDLDRAELRLRDPQELRLAARHRPVQRRVAEQRRSLALLADLRGLALRVQAARAHPAVAAGDVERDDHPVTRNQVGHLRRRPRSPRPWPRGRGRRRGTGTARARRTGADPSRRSRSR